MFERCKKLKSVDLSGWNTQSVTDMRSMFQKCESLTSLDLSGWNLQKLTLAYRTGRAFKGCNNLTSITMKGCDDETVRKIEKALTDDGIRDNVTIVRE